ncbi:unnamed protein product [Oreochromis niloticus]|nr:unnamed protein product [Mustela putorius furo]
MLSRWSPLSLSLIGRINSVKMMLLPKFLYVFQCLPILIPKSFFKSLDSLITSYIWNGKAPKLKKSILQRPKSVGGLGLPNFQYYYWAANIRCLLYWRHYHLEPSPPVWVAMESYLSGKISLPATLGSSLPLASPLPSNNRVVQQSLRIWSQFRQSLGLRAFSLQSPVAANHLFVPSMADNAFHIWHRKGLKSFADLYEDRQFVSFSQISTKFGIAAAQFFRFLQVRHYVQSVTAEFPQMPPYNPVDDFLMLKPTSRGIISALYSLISNLQCSSIAAIKSKWEEDLTFHITDELWDSILGQVHNISMCARHTLIQFKIVHRGHWSRDRLAHIYPGVDPACIRCGGAPGTLFHMYWSCPSLSTFWKSVFHTMSEVVQHQIEPEPLCAMFGAVQNLNLSSSRLRILNFSLLLARRAILLKWKDSSPPSHTQWLKDVLSCMDLEKIRYTVRGSKNKFYKLWSPFLDFFERPTTTVTE